MLIKVPIASPKVDSNIGNIDIRIGNIMINIQNVGIISTENRIVKYLI